VPQVALPATTGGTLDLVSESSGRRLVVFAYPRTGRPGEDSLTPDWDAIPGARGCTPEVCSVRDLHAEFAAAGAGTVGLSTQDTDYQREAAERLSLPYPLLSDEYLELTRGLRLPTFTVAGHELLRRLTMVVRDGMIERVWYPVFPPDTHAADVLNWLQS
ncbi:MAG: peroxiredoxin, partial [Actinomycetota bacterium]|nr:peroxiredoxin [Actinomycetota bacterium]